MTGKDETVDQSAVTQLGAALERLVDEDKVDDKAIDEVNGIVEKLNDKTKAAIMDLPVIQRLVEAQAAKSAEGNVPGTVISQGMFSRKLPYSKRDLYNVWPAVASFTSPETIDVVTPGGWVFKLKQGITYDVPVGTPMAEVPEDHGYQLPSIVVGILADRARDTRQNRRETELRPFGQGVTFLQTGWAGKNDEVANAAAAGHPEPTQ